MSKVSLASFEKDRQTLIDQWVDAPNANPGKDRQQIAGIRAGIAGRISKLEYTVTVAGLKGVTPWVSPAQSHSSQGSFDETAVLEGITNAEGVINDPNVAEGIKDTARKVLDRHVRTMLRRGRFHRVDDEGKVLPQDSDTGRVVRSPRPTDAPES